ncbi:MAG: hypothetical protein U5L04_03010 [Trueperaceae bacterium]|nr:hypothetical protein [Trueperaceae bacterium]
MGLLGLFFTPAPSLAQRPARRQTTRSTSAAPEQDDPYRPRRQGDTL